MNSQVKEIFDILYDHQKQSLTKLMEADRGKIILPTDVSSTEANFIRIYL